MDALEAAEWAALWERCPDSTPFQHPGWLLPWWRRVWRGGRQWWVALRDAGRLAGVAPMFMWGGERRSVALAGAGISDYLDFLIEPEHARAGAAMVLEHLARHPERWDVCDFHDLRAGSALPEAVPETLEARVEGGAVCPVVRLPRSAEEYRAGLDPRFRHNLHRARNRVRNAGGVVEAACAENLEEWLDALFRLHAARWQGGGVLAGLEEFHREAARELLGAGLLRTWGLRIEGVPAAVLYGFAGHGRYYAYLDGFDPARARLSPGAVLIAHAIECAIAEGMAEFDFLRDGESFKYEWGAADRTSRRLVLCRR